MKNNVTKKIVTASILAALVCVATMIIKIPSPFKGYINLGDGIVLISGWLLSPAYGFLAAGIGSGLADILSGYALYAPVTFIVKGVMALVAYWGFSLLHKKLGTQFSRIISGVLSEICMVLGYFVFEAILYGIAAAAMNITANIVQGVAGVVIGTVLMQLFEKYKIFK